MCETSQQENKCCSTTTTYRMEKPSMEKCVQIAEAGLVGTSPSPLAEEVDRCCGYVTELHVSLQVVMDQVAEALRLAQPSQMHGLSTGVGLRETLHHCRRTLWDCSRIVTVLGQHLRQREDSDGQKQTADSQCQCTRMKGRSLG